RREGRRPAVDRARGAGADLVTHWRRVAPTPTLPRKRGRERSRAASRRVAQVRFVIPLTSPLLPHEADVSLRRSRGRAAVGATSVAADPAPIPTFPRKRGKGRSRAAVQPRHRVRFVVPLTSVRPTKPMSPSPACGGGPGWGRRPARLILRPSDPPQAGEEPRRPAAPDRRCRTIEPAGRG